MTTAAMSPLPMEQNAADIPWWTGTMTVFELIRFTAKLINEPCAIVLGADGAVVDNDLGVCDRILADLICIYILSPISKFY